MKGLVGPIFRLAAIVLSICSAVSTAYAVDGHEGGKEPFLVPQTVYVGDRARLVVPLDPTRAAAIRVPLVIDVADRLPRSKDAVILRIELQRVEGGSRALLDFAAYAPGTVELPRMEAGGLVFSGLSVSIASILDAEGGVAELSPLAGPLAAPGTALLVYGASSSLIVSILIAIFLVMRGPALIKEALARRKRALVARSMRRVIARLGENIDRLDPAEFFSILFSELRSYLTYRTGVNYVALTPREIPAAVAARPPRTEASKGFDVRLRAVDGLFLETLFRRGDEVRFGGAPMAATELRTSLSEVVALIDRIESDLDAMNRSSGETARRDEAETPSSEGRSLR